jgi:transcriptional regulator with PAS, ATPase and Fis domain
MPFVGYTWPGNVRELQHEIERLVLMMGEDGIIWPEDVSAKIRRRPEECALEEACGRRLPDLSFQQAVAQYKRWLVEEALKECGGNVTQAAKRLGLKRQMLQWLMRQMGVKRGDNE